MARSKVTRDSVSVTGRSTRAHHLSNRQARWIYPGLLLLAVLPYLQTFQFDFVNFDDKTYVTENAAVQQGLTWSNVLWAFTSLSAGNWHPLAWLSHMLDCQLFGLQPGWHHLSSVLIHGTNTIMLFVGLRALTGVTWRSALVAALFAVHPLHVESVAWIAERKDVLSTFFAFCAIWAYAQYARRPAWPRYASVAGFFALSLLSKPMLVTLPFVLLLLDFWPLNRATTGESARGNRSSLALLAFEKLPLLAMSAASSLVTIKAQHAAGAMARIDLLPLSQRLANAIAAYPAYLSKALWPVDLAAIYPLSDQIPIGRTVLALLVLAGITSAIVLLSAKRGWLPVGWLWFLGTLVPVIGLVQVGDQAMADRYTYFPFIGLFIMIAWSLPGPPFAASDRKKFLMTTAGIGLALAILGILTFIQVRVWRNTITLFNHAIKVTTGNFTAHNLLAGALIQHGDLDGARVHLDQSLRIKPNYAGAHYNLGLILMHEQNFPAAQEQFRLALQNVQNDPVIWNGLGAARMKLGQTDEAVANYQHALELDPDYASALANLGSAYLVQGNYSGAIAAAERAAKLRPDAAEPHVTLAGALLAKDDFEGAIKQAESVLQLDPRNGTAQEILTKARSKRPEGESKR